MEKPLPLCKYCQLVFYFQLHLALLNRWNTYLWETSYKRPTQASHCQFDVFRGKKIHKYILIKTLEYDWINTDRILKNKKKIDRNNKTKVNRKRLKYVKEVEKNKNV